MTNFLRVVKWIVFVLIILLVTIVVFQNLTPVQLHFLFTTIEMPQAITVTVATVTGFVLGLIASALWRMRSWRAKAAKEKKTQSTGATQSSPL